MNRQQYIFHSPKTNSWNPKISGLGRNLRCFPRGYFQVPCQFSRVLFALKFEFEGFVNLSNSGELCWCSWQSGFTQCVSSRCSPSWVVVVVVFRIPKIFSLKFPSSDGKFSVDSWNTQLFGTVGNSTCLNMTTCHAIAIVIVRKRIGKTWQQQWSQQQFEHLSDIPFFPWKAWFCCQYFWGRKWIPYCWCFRNAPEMYEVSS